jgi:lipoprotein-anchoring transpeptidase ErfK/SrfK
MPIAFAQSFACASSIARRATFCLAVTMVGSSGASAQTLNWDWGGEKKVDGSGRELVRMAAAKKPGEIIVSFSDRKLYFVTAVGEALSYPIAVPREQSRWQGAIAVTAKRENPSWTPTPSMRTENSKLPSWVPGGHPMNPLGIRALYLGSSTYRIHGTDAPWTIGSAVSKGCVRMYNQDVLDLYPRVNVGASVLVTWDKFTTSSTPDAKVASEADDAEKKLARKSPVAATDTRASVKTGSLRQKAGQDTTKPSAPTPADRTEAAAPKPRATIKPAPKTPKKDSESNDPLWI